MKNKKQLKIGKTYIIKYMNSNAPYTNYDGKGVYTGEIMDGDGKGELWFGFTLLNQPYGAVFFGLGDIFEDD